MTWLGHVLGLDDASGYWYLWWSGIGADLGYLAVFGALIAIVRKHACHVRRCWRIGRLPIDSSAWVVCHRHHPEEPPTAADVCLGEKGSVVDGDLGHLIAWRCIEEHAFDPASLGFNRRTTFEVSDNLGDWRAPTRREFGALLPLLT
jgi:hypothetical protein